MNWARRTDKEHRIGLLQTTGLGMLMLSLPVAFAQQAYAQETPAGQVTEDVVTITGHRLSTEKAIQAQKDAQGVVNVLSTDDLGKLPDANVADALARVPGVNVVVNQDTGEGEFVTVRGFAGTYNAYSINGVRVATSDPDSRQVSMTVLPPNGLQSIAVSKTLTPDLDGDAIGGAVDFRTPTAFDFNAPVLRAFLTYGVNSRANDTGIDDDTTGLEFQYGSKFGALENWGFFAAANYNKSHGANEETENDGEWEPYRFRLNSTEQIDERSMYLPGVDLDYRRNEQERIGGNFSIDYRAEKQELYLKGQYATFARTSTNDWTDFRTRPSERLEQVNINDTSLLQPERAVVGFNPTKGRVYNYTVAQMKDKDGDGLITDDDRYSWSDTNNDGVLDRGSPFRSYWSLYGRSGVWDPQQMQFSRNMDISDQDQILGTLNVGGKSVLGALKLDYDVSYSYGEKKSPDSFYVGYNCDRCGVLGQNGVSWSSPDPRFPLPQLPGPVADVERRDDYLEFDGASHSRSKQSDSRLAAKLDATWDFEGTLDYVKAGAKILRSEREYDNTPIFEGDLLGSAATTMDQSGLVERQIGSFLDGRYYFGSIMSRARVIEAILAAQAADPNTISAEDLLSDDKSGEENIYAAYALANFKFDALEVIAGARFEATDVSNTAWNGEPAEGQPAAFTTTDSDYSNFLPSVTAIYRPSEEYVFRGAVWTSFSRPEYSNMFAGERVVRNAAGEVLARQLGSPNLKPAESLNVDVSAEYYPDETSMVSASAFYKKIDNFIFTYGSSVQTSTSVGQEEISQIKNGENASIYGVELNFIKEFAELPEPFDGFGVSANLTLQESEAETGIDYRKGRAIPFIAAPDMLGNASLSYQKGPFQALLSYNYQGKYIESLRDNAVDKWVQPIESLDFHSRWTFNDSLSVDFDVQNILDGYRYYTTKGDNPTYMKDYMEPGRTFLVKLTYTH